MVAALNTPAAFAEAQKRSAFRPRPNSPISRMLATKAPYTSPIFKQRKAISKATL